YPCSANTTPHVSPDTPAPIIAIRSAISPWCKRDRKKTRSGDLQIAVETRRIVGRLTRSLPLTRSNELPVYVARVPAAPFCEMPILGVRRGGRPTVWYVPNLEAAFKVHQAWFHSIEMRSRRKFWRARGFRQTTRWNCIDRLWKNWRRLRMRGAIWQRPKATGAAAARS